MDNKTLIKQLMTLSQNKGKAELDIGSGITGTKTFVTVKKKSFRVEKINITRNEIFVEGYHEKEPRRSIRLDYIDESSLPELAWCVNTALFPFIEHKKTKE